MIEITNRECGPVQLMVKSKNKVSGFTTKVLPGRGKKQNVYVINDEDKTDQMDLLESLKLISMRTVAAKK